MRPKIIKSLTASSLLLVTLASSPLALAADVWWNNTSTTWGTSTATWNTAADGTGTTQTWTNGDSAFFSAGTGLNAGPYTLTNGGVTVDNITQEEGRIRIQTGTLTLADAAMVIDTQVRVSGDYDVRIDSVLADSGLGASSITKNGGGILMLTATNTFSGGLTLNAGTIALESNGSSLGSGVVTLNGGNLVKSWGNPNDITIANNMNVTGTTNVAIVQGQRGNFLFSGAMTGSGTFQVANTAVNGLSTFAGSIGLRGDLSGFTGTIDFNSTGTAASNRLRLGVSGTGQIIDLSNATVTMSGNSGATGTSVVDMNDNASGTVRIGELSGAGGNLTVGWGAAAATTFEVGAKNTDSVFAGRIYDNVNAAGTGKAALHKVGDGMLTISGANTYTGGTTVSAGTLYISGSLGASDVTVESGATIGGDGTIGGNLVFEAGSQLLFSVTETLSVNGSSVSFVNFGIADLAGLTSAVAEGVYDLIDGAATIDFDNLSNVGVENAYDLGGGKFAYFQEGSLQVVVIPEPASALLGGFGMLLLLRRRRK